MVFKTWEPIFGTWISHSGFPKIQTWKLLGHAFQDVGPQFWDLDFRTGGGGYHDPGPGNFLGHGFQDVGSHLWDPKIQTWKLLGHDFQDVGPQFWDLDFRTGGGGFHDPGPGNF
jgi:hypothetical protein